MLWESKATQSMPIRNSGPAIVHFLNGPFGAAFDVRAWLNHHWPVAQRARESPTKTSQIGQTFANAGRVRYLVTMGYLDPNILGAEAAIALRHLESAKAAFQVESLRKVSWSAES